MAHREKRDRKGGNYDEHRGPESAQKTEILVKGKKKPRIKWCPGKNYSKNEETVLKGSESKVGT